jgi:HSP20 family protein
MAMPMDAYRKDDSFLLQLDLPGVTPESIELTVDENVLTISAERSAPPNGRGHRIRDRRTNYWNVHQAGRLG